MTLRKKNININLKKIEKEESDSSSTTSSSDSEESNNPNIIMNSKTDSKSKEENQTNIIITTAKNCIYIAYDTTKIYLLWIVIHYLASQYYVPFCSPRSIWGFIITPILAATPQCKGLRWVINTGGNTMETMWVILGVWVCTKIMPSTCETLFITTRQNNVNRNRDRAKSFENMNE